MALPLLKLIDMTGDLSVPKTVVLLQVLPAGGRRRLGRLTLVRNEELKRNLIVFDSKNSGHLKTRFS